MWLISIHAPRGRGDAEYQAVLVLACQISIHAPRGRGDPGKKAPCIPRAISIHAPRGRGDVDDLTELTEQTDFNPRPSREGRQSSTLSV